MKILGIESSSLVASVALLDGDCIAAEYSINHKLTHSQTLLPMLANIKEVLDLDLQSIDAIAVSGGPGSFTGLRIGAATAKGLASALQKPLIHVPTLDATAYGIYGAEGIIVPLMDARREQVYTGSYRHEEFFQVLTPARALGIAELTAELNERYEDVIFLGDGVPVHRAFLQEHLRIRYRFAPASHSRQRAGALLGLAKQYYAEGKLQSPRDFQVEYLRKSQAEREKEAADAE